MPTFDLHRPERRADHVVIAVVLIAVRAVVLGRYRLGDARRWIGGAR